MKSIPWFLLTLAVMQSASADTSYQESTQLLLIDPIAVAHLNATEVKYGVQCDRTSAQNVSTVTGYYNDFNFFVTLNCGKPNLTTDFTSFKIRFFATITEFSGALHVTCVETKFLDADFGSRDPVSTCVVPPGFEHYGW